MTPIELPAGFTDARQVGSGGLGDVFVARRVSTGGDVALKVLRELADQQVMLRRAYRERDALASLRGHLNVVHLEDVLQTDDGRVILVMEFMSGGSIDRYARHLGGSLPLEQTLMVGECAASALSAAHGKGIVHRDIKPQNLLVNSFGHVKVCDFGISSLATSAEFADRTDALSYRYASPEEIRGDEHVGPLTDVYSLGVTLANLLTGRHVSNETAGRLLEPASTPSSSANDAAGQERAFREILVACLSADLDDRPDSPGVRLRPRTLPQR